MNDQPIVIQLELPASHRFLNVLSACIAESLNRIEQVTDRENTQYQLQLGAQEICTNIVDHAYVAGEAGRIWIRLEIDENIGEFLGVFMDTGLPYQEVDTEALTIDEPSEGGMGLFLIYQMLDSVSYERNGTTNIWRILKRL